MESVLKILGINEVMVYFAYGQVFFTLGVIIALQSRKHSRLALAHHLRWLAAFGLVHGIYEWGHTFIPIQATYLSAGAVDSLKDIRTVLLAFSFYLLLQFGILVTFPNCRRYWLLRFIPMVVLLAWLALAIGSGAIVLAGSHVTIRLPQATDSIRFTLGFTGAALSCFGMIRQARIVADAGSRRIAWYFRWAALCFGLYAVVAGLIASRSQWTFSTLLGSPFFAGVVLVPTPVMRSLAGLGIAFGVVRGLKVFQMETDKYIEERNELQRKEETRAHLFARVMAAQEEERKRVARELHDETGQSISAVIMGLGAATENLPRDPIKAREIIEDSREVAVHTLAGVRQIILGLRPALLDDLGLAPALRRLAEDLSKRSSAQIEVLSNSLDGRLPPAVETVLFRILQEGMSNVARHAGARRAVLRLAHDESTVLATLEDDGIGFDPTEATAHLETGRGLGLVGMRERASLLGGTVAIDSAPSRGTRLRVELPLVERG